MKIENIIKKTEKIVLDTGIYIDYFSTRKNFIKGLFRKTLFSEGSKIRLYSNHIIKSDLYYIFCRNLGKKKAE